MNFIQEFEHTIDKFLREINDFKEQLYHLNECKLNLDTKITETNVIQRKDNLTLLKKLKLKEGEWDRLNEYNMRNKMLLDKEKTMNDLIVEFQQHYFSIIKMLDMNKDIYSDQMNELLIETKRMEKELKGKQYTNEFKLNNYEIMFIGTKKYEKIKHEKQKKKE